MQQGFGGCDFPELAQLKEKINSRGLPGPALTQQPDFVPPTQNFVPKRRFVRSVAVRRAGGAAEEEQAL